MTTPNDVALPGDQPAENVWPTPEQWAARFISMPRAERLAAAAQVLEHARSTAHCFIANHEGLKAQLDDAHVQLGESYDDARLGVILRRVLTGPQAGYDSPCWTSIAHDELRFDGGIAITEDERGFLAEIIPDIERSDDVAPYADLFTEQAPDEKILDTGLCYICAVDNHDPTHLDGNGWPTRCPTRLTRAAADLIRRERGEEF